MALTADTNLVKQDGELLSLPMAAEKIYQGALVKINAAGYAAKSAAEAGSTFAGIAYEQKDNSAGAAGDKVIRVENTGAFILPIASATQADVGSKVYAAADDVVTLTEGADKKPIVGVIVKVVSATKVLVRLSAFTGTGA